VINEKLREARREKGLTQGKLAERIGLPCDDKMISRWERSIVTPSPEYREKLCKILEKTPEELRIIPPPRTPRPSTPTNLPMRLPKLIGRKDAIDKICDWLQHPETHPDTRLLTLTGAPGIGKTSLALHVEEKLKSKSVFDNGIFYVSLNAISETNQDFIVAALARRLGLEDTGAPQLLDRLKTHLYGKQMLLVLDSADHLIQTCAELAEKLLQSCPKLTLLTTSNKLLGIEEEQAWPVHPLQYPDLNYLPSIEQLRKCSAVELFETCTQKVDRGFTITDKNAYVVSQICARLDGHPLAIKLAAGKITLSVWQIAEQLDNCLTFLRGESRTGTKRHMTIQEAIEWSYDPLPEDEKLLLQRLSVFKGGWTLEAAKAVCAGDGLEIENIQGMIEDLAKKSLVEAEERGETKRCWLLEIIRQYADKKLYDAGEAEDIHRRHRDFFFQMAEEYELRREELASIAWYNSLATEYGNLRTALTWCLNEQDSGDIFFQFVVNLFYLWVAGNWTEGRHWLAKALERADETNPSPLYAEILNLAGFLANLQCDYKQASLLIEKSITTYKELGNEHFAKVIQALHSTIKGESVGHSALISLYKEKTTINAEIGERLSPDAPFLKVLAAIIGNNRNNPTEARILLENALQQYTEQDNKKGEAACLSFIGEIDVLEDNYLDALISFKKSLALYQILADTPRTARSLADLGVTMLLLENYKEGEVLLKESMKLSLLVGDKDNIYWCLIRLAELARVVGRQEQAVCLYGSIKALSESFTGMPLSDIFPYETKETTEAYETNIANLREQLGEQAFTKAWNNGHTMTLQEAVAYACTKLLLTE